MGNFKKLLLSTILILAGSAVFASQIAIQIVQHDETSEEVCEQSFVIEDELMNGFFENGYIVTNSPASISKSENTDSSLWYTGFGEAYDGYSDYFVQIKLYYSVEKVGIKEMSVISRIDWSLTSVSSGTTLKNSSLRNFGESSKNKDAKFLSKYLINEIKQAIKA
ncbi:MAG: hypothetical protein K6A43_10840 [Treponema sp.]|nr:hypothetical protein [Treponema sp.]